MSALAYAEPLVSVPADRGRFRWHARLGMTCWSPSVHRLHGYQPGVVVPSAAVALEHKHPDDLLGCVDVLHRAMLTNRLVVHEHRLVAADGEVRQVLMVARPVVDELGPADQLCGFLLPVDESEGEAHRTRPSSTGALSWLPATFAISVAAVRVLLAAQRPTAAWRQPPLRPLDEVATTSGSDHRRDLEDRMFPLEHLTLGPVRIPV